MILDNKPYIKNGILLLKSSNKHLESQEFDRHSWDLDYQPRRPNGWVHAADDPD